jgi:alkanesulfonate monooxygenase SsuD/methylene tetrahydromethanopterin reductase-like flavin-dependent oxidoreductase (luciferase family)
MVEWARLADAAGWDGFFIWDHVVFWKEAHIHVEDPWVLLAAMAIATSRIRLGPMVTPIPRRRPWKLARECVSLDHLSNGRLVFGAGLGAPVEADYVPFGEPVPTGAQLDEGLAVLSGLWSGEPFSFSGRHYVVDDVTFRPRPLQQPRPPIWIAGTWPKRGPIRRAARWDGAFPLKYVAENQPAQLTPDDVRALRDEIAAQRSSMDGFDLVIGGVLGEREERLQAYAEAGLTWWVEGLDWWSYKDPRSIADRINAGPPRGL